MAQTKYHKEVWEDGREIAIATTPHDTTIQPRRVVPAKTVAIVPVEPKEVVLEAEPQTLEVFEEMKKKSSKK